MILLRFLIACAILCCVQGQLGTGGTISDRMHSRVQRKIDLIDKIASNRRISAKLVKAQVRGDGSSHFDDSRGTASAEWVKKLSARVSSVHQHMHKRMASLNPAGQANRANADDSVTPKIGSTGVETRLRRHGDASVVAKEVAHVASQQLPRSTISEQLRRKFPHLESGEVNDIIVAAHLHLGRGIPLLSAMHEQDRQLDARKDLATKADNDRAPPDWFKAKA